MHTNYYFLRQLAPALTERLQGYRVAACFSQEKDELVVGLTNGAAEFWLKAQLGANFPALALPETFQRARANSVDLFPELLGQQVETVVPWPQDRVVQVNFRSGARLVFKLYGPRPNAIFRPRPEAPAQLFQQRLLADADLRPQPNAAPPVPGKLPPPLADLPARYLREHGYDPAPPETKTRLVNQVLAQLEKPAHYYLIQLDGRTRLSLLPLGEIIEPLPGDDPIRALRRFVPMALGRRALEMETKQLRQLLERRAEEASTAAAHARQRLHALAHEAGYRHTADLIMANLHDIPAGATQVEVVDFYTNQPRLIKLKRTEKPQLTAENLYRKGKNQQIEERQLTERITRREAEALTALERLEELETQPNLAELRGLRAWRKQHGLDPTPAAAKAATELPFKVFEDRGFTILVGRNAVNNDLLTQKYAHKDDLWLHAKDVTGSHVVIRHRAGQPVPEPVVEHAAQLAGWYSRRQHDTLCPVTVTPKKFVRKPKGALPGQVVVERERVVLVKPGNPFDGPDAL
ncbi:NFACT RNA binding domain-containing protein [Hymenobacter sp. BT770]|uniref:NFACT RNA binding domain-containing protein n=1 Tax=Hymenobacter sp. BT770 TaxID=2886942 RepID=UPI001D129537|nr:NFACT RNA binding domain-containing protein [Hymenobacter sp. BT770]MCC3152063.1 NFACT RNA binding domain-containing protein [Hymenobacter sp. BT770]MDO3415254.1 NFACT RNA binding domain-containing protein [Hymenobacter sp. BT770]